MHRARPPLRRAHVLGCLLPRLCWSARHQPRPLPHAPPRLLLRRALEFSIVSLLQLGSMVAVRGPFSSLLHLPQPCAPASMAGCALPLPWPSRPSSLPLPWQLSPRFHPARVPGSSLARIPSHVTRFSMAGVRLQAAVEFPNAPSPSRARPGPLLLHGRLFPGLDLAMVACRFPVPRSRPAIALLDLAVTSPWTASSTRAPVVFPPSRSALVTVE